MRNQPAEESPNRDEATALNEPPKRRGHNLPSNAKCSRCGFTGISLLPGFAVGMGIAARPVANDVICLRCGMIAPYTVD